MKRKSRILIVGHHSLAGLALAGILEKKGFSDLIIPKSAEINLAEPKSAYSFFRKNRPNYIILAPIKEGGIEANIKFPAELIYENIATQTNVIHSAWKIGIKKLIYFASSCVYPKNCPQPIKEEYLLSGSLEKTNESYAVAKIAGIKMCQVYRNQYGADFISVIPATVYGPGDNFDLNASHVIPGLIRKLFEAKERNASCVSIWGTGKPKREFIYADDIADACVYLLQHRNSYAQINIGCGKDISIRELTVLISDIIGFKGKLKFDSNKPDGVLRKLLDSSKLNSLGWEPRVSLEEGLQKTCQWYISRR